MKPYTVSVEIDLPRDEVIALFDNTENLYKWQDGLQNFEHLSGEPGRVGARSKLTFAIGSKTIELFETISRSRLKTALDKAALPSVAFWSRAGHRGDDGPLHLVEIADFVERNDPRLTALTESLGDAGRRALSVGGFAMPIRLDPSDPAVAVRQAS